jgi:hypothetical protein
MADSVQIVGPFKDYEVVVNGWQVPHLYAIPLPDDRLYINLDRRFSVYLSREVADEVLVFLAHCMAFAAGYSCHPDGDEAPPRRHPFIRVHQIRESETC